MAYVPINHRETPSTKVNKSPIMTYIEDPRYIPWPPNLGESFKMLIKTRDKMPDSITPDQKVRELHHTIRCAFNALRKLNDHAWLSTHTASSMNKEDRDRVCSLLKAEGELITTHQLSIEHYVAYGIGHEANEAKNNGPVVHLPSGKVQEEVPTYRGKGPDKK